MMYKELYKSIFMYYNGDNEITIGMNENLIEVFRELWNDSDTDTKRKVGHLLTMALRCKKFSSFEKYAKKIIDLKQYPIELSNYLVDFDRWANGERKTFPV